MKSIFLHIDYNSYFATVEQQANPRLRGKPIGVTGGDRMERTVIGAASIEAKALGVSTGMSIQEARKICPQLILVRGDSDKYLACTKRFINILKDYSPYLEIFSIDEAFLELKIPEIPSTKIQDTNNLSINNNKLQVESLSWSVFLWLYCLKFEDWDFLVFCYLVCCSWNLADNEVEIDHDWQYAIEVAVLIKERIYQEVGEWLRVSIGISYNKTLAKLAGSRQKPNGLYVIADEEAAMRILDQVDFEQICGIGPRTKKHLYNMGIPDFPTLRKIPLSILLSAFKSYGNFLYNISRGLNFDEIVPFYEKPEVKSVGHQHTLWRDTNDPLELKQTLLKMCEMVAKRLRDKKLVGRTVVCFFRSAFNEEYFQITGHRFFSNGMQKAVIPTDDGLEIFNAAWGAFEKMWDREKVRLLGVSVSNVSPKAFQTMSLLPDVNRQEVITKVLDKVNDRFGDFVLRRGTLLGAEGFRRKPNPFLSDRRFKI